MASPVIPLAFCKQQEQKTFIQDSQISFRAAAAKKHGPQEKAAIGSLDMETLPVRCTHGFSAKKHAQGARFLRRLVRLFFSLLGRKNLQPIRHIFLLGSLMLKISQGNIKGTEVFP